MPPPHQYWLVEFRERLLQVGYLGRLAGLASKGVGVTPAHVLGRYHQSLRISFICRGTVVPTNVGKLMVLFLSILGWIVSESLGRSDGLNRCIICNLH